MCINVDNVKNVNNVRNVENDYGPCGRLVDRTSF